MDLTSGLKTDATLMWRNSGQICALSDGERHIGHLVRIGGRWHAYDAMHSNKAGDGFLSPGTFIAIDCAKDAVEQSYRQLPLSVAEWRKPSGIQSEPRRRVALPAKQSVTRGTIPVDRN